jgi:hypothetical protein
MTPGPTRSRLVALAMSAAVAAGVLVAPGTAVAASACHPTSRSFAIPNALDVEVTILLCVRTLRGGKVYATALVEWNRDNFGRFPDNTFENFVLNLRLERSGRDVREAGCNVRPSINRYRDGQFGCRTARATKGPSRRWTADGHVVANIDSDGAANRVWPLRGTRPI